MADWKSLAVSEANRQGCPIDIALATVDAETSGQNIVGDNGNALGYGQVWPTWHMQAFYRQGGYLGLSVPFDLQGLTDLVLSNDQFSMAVAVDVIKQTWESANGDFYTFTHSYVGPNISDSDYSRREKIWNNYHNSNFDYNGTASYVSSNGTVAKGISEIPATNYGIINGSQQYKNVLYGRKYRVIVSDISGENALDVSELRCTFTCVKNMLMETNYSQVTLYNLSAETENTIIQEGARIVIEAGYEGGQYGLIFDGNIIQPIREKEDGTTYKLTLISLDADMYLNYSVAAFSMYKGQNSRDVVRQCASKASIPSQIGSISENLSNSQLTRGKVVFGPAGDYLRQVAQGESATFYMDDGKINIVRVDDLPSDEIIELAPDAGLIGVPTQKDYGVNAKCLLNPQIKLNSLIHINNQLVRNQQFQQGQPIYSMDNDGIYRVIKVTYSGDTRGDDWYTEVETVSQAGKLPGMIANPGAYGW